MKTSIFIHIGTHKTGTSVVQKMLAEKSNTLKNEGVKYINLYNFEGALQIMSLESIETSLVMQLREFINSHLDASYSKYLICCEYLSGNPKALYSNSSLIARLLKETLDHFEEIGIFVALRKQEQFIQSIYTQYLHQAEDVPMETFLDEVKLSNIKWCSFLYNYQSVFGVNNVKCIPYDKKVLESKNVINHFGEFSNIKCLQNIDLGKLNLGYSKDAVEIAKLSNPNLNKEEQKILRLLMQENLNKGVFSKYELLDPARVKYIDNFFKNDNQKLFDTFFKEFDLEGFSELEPNSDEQNKFNNSYIKLIVLLVKKINELKRSNSSQSELNLKRNLRTIVSAPKQIIKKSLKKLIKTERNDFAKNVELKQTFGDYKKSVILGSAESINKIDITKISDDLVISVGNFFEHPEINKINPKIHIFASSHPPITKEVLIKWYTRAEKTLPKDTVILVEKSDIEVARSVFKMHKFYQYAYGGHLPADFTKPILSPWSVTIVALQLAIYCETQTIGILGVDHDWQCIKPYRHFYDHNKPSLEFYLHEAGIPISYEKQRQPFPKERLYREYELYQQYEALKIEAKKLNLKIFNYDPFSDFDVFEFKRQNNLIKETV